MSEKFVQQAEESIRDREEQSVAVQTVADITADYWNTLIDRGVNEMSATILTTVWLSLTFDSKK